MKNESDQTKKGKNRHNRKSQNNYYNKGIVCKPNQWSRLVDLYNYERAMATINYSNGWQTK